MTDEIELTSVYHSVSTCLSKVYFKAKRFRQVHIEFYQ